MPADATGIVLSDPAQGKLSRNWAAKGDEVGPEAESQAADILELKWSATVHSQEHTAAPAAHPC